MLRCRVDGQAGITNVSGRPFVPRCRLTTVVRPRAGMWMSTPVMKVCAKNTGSGALRSVTRSLPASKAKIPMVRLDRGLVASLRMSRPLTQSRSEEPPLRQSD